jgi:hypothetical protein
MTWREDDNVVFKYSDERRHDPDLNAKVAKVIEAQTKAVEDATALIKQAAEIMRKASGFENSEIFERCYDSVKSARYTLDRDERFVSLSSETYIQNASAGRLGYQITKMGEKFPL